MVTRLVSSTTPLNLAWLLVVLVFLAVWSYMVNVRKGYVETRCELGV